MGLFHSIALAIVEATALITASPSPWCLDPSAPAQPGMYGDLGVDLIGPRGTAGQYHDVPASVAPLWQQGLAHLWGFNHVEAYRNFDAATTLEEACALCWWGRAAALAPNINYVIENQTVLNLAVSAAIARLDAQPDLSAKTQLIIRSLGAFVQDPSTPDGANSTARRAFAQALCAPQPSGADADVDSMCAGATMALTPWDYYAEPAPGAVGALRAELVPAKAKLLDAASKGRGGPDAPHALAIHLLIHLLEPTDAPPEFKWEALPATQRLFAGGGDGNGTALMPAQGHLTHMPAHLFLRVGRYKTGVQTSQRSVQNNRRYSAACLAPYAYGHNLKMLAANARMAGMAAAALEAAREAGAPEAGAERTPYNGTHCVDCAGAASPEAVLTLARFGRWAAVLAEELPRGSWGDASFARYNQAGWHHARALALYATGAVDAADAAAAAALAAASNASLGGDGGFRGYLPALLRAEAAAARAWRVDANATAAAAALRQAVAAADDVPYLEPPRWFYPPRHCLGFALLAPGSNASEALETFQVDLRAFPENGWSLLGAANASAALGDAAAAAEYTERASVAWQFADAPLSSPCPQLSA